MHKRESGKQRHHEKGERGFVKKKKRRERAVRAT